MKFALALLGIAAISLEGLSAEVPTVWDHPAAMSMGGAYTSVANDDSAFWTNPAGIVRTKKARSKERVPLYRTPNMTFGANNKKVAANISKLSSSSKRFEIITDALNESNGERPVWVAGGAELIGIFSQNPSNPIGVAFYNHTTTQMQVDSEDITGKIDGSTNVRSNILSDTAGLVNFAFADKSNRASFGFQFRYIASRFSLNTKTPLSQLTTKSGFEDNLKPKGSNTKGLAIDLGGLYTYPDFWFPTVGFAIFNLPTGCMDNYLNPFNETRESVCGTVFKGDISADDPRAVDPTDIRLGFSITPRFSKTVSTRLAVDVHNLAYASGSKNYGLSDIPLDRMLHAGMEFFLGNPLAASPFRLKLGMNQTSFSVGGTMTLGSGLIIDIARYGKDIASGPTPRPDTRYLINLGFMF
ncbi:MAG: hypothetical protein WCI18_07065 [Pseudomonadota bacterium]